MEVQASELKLLPLPFGVLMAAQGVSRGPWKTLLWAGLVLLLPGQLLIPAL